MTVPHSPLAKILPYQAQASLTEGLFFILFRSRCMSKHRSSWITILLPLRAFLFSQTTCFRSLSRKRTVMGRTRSPFAGRRWGAPTSAVSTFSSSFLFNRDATTSLHFSFACCGTPMMRMLFFSEYCSCSTKRVCTSMKWSS